MSRDVIAYIDKNALLHNFNKLKQQFPHASILAMIKSNGYGHGLVSTAKTLNSADALGVACLEEALTLRKTGITTPIVVMSGFLDEAELKLFQQHDIHAVIHHTFQIDLLEKSIFTKPLTVWVKIDTGMHRLGFLPEEIENVYKRLQKITGIIKPLHWMTHLAHADQDAIYTEQQIQQFQQLIAHYSGPKSIANSATILAYSNSHSDWIRPGIMLYGVSPFTDRTGVELGLKPVMTLQAKLIANKIIKKNNPVGYGCTWRSPEEMPIGIVAIGYGDGYPRHARSGTPTLIHHTVCPLIGRVSMDMIAIDLRPFSQAKIGDTVTLWGEGLPVEKIAECAGTIGYELLCNVTQRVKFVERES